MDQKVNIIFGSSVKDPKEIEKRIEIINNTIADMAVKYILEKGKKKKGS